MTYMLEANGMFGNAHLRRSAEPHALRRMHIRLRSMRPDIPSTPERSTTMPSSIQAVILSPGADNPGIHRSSGAIGASRIWFLIQGHLPTRLLLSYVYVTRTPAKKAAIRAHKSEEYQQKERGAGSAQRMKRPECSLWLSG